MATVIRNCSPSEYCSTKRASDAMITPAMTEAMADQREIFLVMIPSNTGIALGTAVSPKKMVLIENIP